MRPPTFINTLLIPLPARGAKMVYGGDCVSYVSMTPNANVLKNMFATIINDCRDENAFGRQATRVASLLECPVITVGVSSDLEAGGTLIDILNASDGKRGVVLVNVAPRNGEGKKWGNGVPFGYFYYKETLVVTSMNKTALSFVHKFGVSNVMQTIDIAEVTAYLLQKNMLTPEQAELMQTTQFRSFDFLPYVAIWIFQGTHSLPQKELILESSLGGVVWYIDVFGNAKTTLLPEDALLVLPKEGKMLQTLIGEFQYIPHLKDVPDGVAAFVVGSSGLGGKKFFEIVIQGGNAAERFGLKVGTKVL